MPRRGEKTSDQSRKNSLGDKTTVSSRDDISLSSPGGRRYTIPEEYKNDTNFVRSKENKHRLPHNQLTIHDIRNLRNHEQNSSKGWLRELPDPSKRIWLQHKDGVVLFVPQAYSAMGAFFKETGLTSNKLYNLRTRACQTSNGWRLIDPPEGETVGASSGQGPSREHQQESQAGSSQQPGSDEAGASGSGKDSPTRKFEESKKLEESGWWKDENW